VDPGVLFVDEGPVLTSAGVASGLDLCPHLIRQDAAPTWRGAPRGGYRAVKLAAGILVLGITVLIVDQVMRMRQLRDRSRATAAQAAIVLLQATRATQTASDALRGSGDRATASDEVRT
jgi:hypothetical protein